MTLSGFTFSTEMFLNNTVMDPSTIQVSLSYYICMALKAFPQPHMLLLKKSTCFSLEHVTVAGGNVGRRRLIVSHLNQLIISKHTSALITAHCTLFKRTATSILILNESRSCAQPVTHRDSVCAYIRTRPQSQSHKYTSAPSVFLHLGGCQRNRPTFKLLPGYIMRKNANDMIYFTNKLLFNFNLILI